MLMTNKHIKMEHRQRFFQAYVRSRMTYACQTWNPSQRQLQRLDSAQLRLLRRMMYRGNSYVHMPTLELAKNLTPAQKRAAYEEAGADFRLRYSNEDVYRLTQSEPISDYIRRQQLKFTAHIIRQGNERSTKQLMFPGGRGKKFGDGMPSLLKQAYAQKSDLSTDQFHKAARDRKF